MSNTTYDNGFKPLDVVLTNGWDRISYNILRSLAQSGLTIGFGVDCHLGMGVFSKYNHIKFVHAPYYEDEMGFVKDVIAFIQKHKPGVYIPTGEEIFVVAKYQHLFDSLNVKIPVSPYSTLIDLHDKIRSFHIAERLGIPVPASIIPKSFADIRSFGNQYGYPVVLKKSQSSSAKGVYYLQKANLDNELEYLYKNISLQYGKFFIQELVSGVGCGVSLLLNKGQVRAVFSHKRIRERIYSGGPSTNRVSTKNEIFEDYAIRLLTDMKFHGVAMVEFKYDEKSKEGWFLEVNPRFWGSIGLAINSGVDFPYLLYKMAVDGDVLPVKSYKLNLTYRWLLGDIFAVLSKIKASKNPFVIKELFQKADGFDDFYKDDPFPFFARIFLLLRRNIKRNIRIQ